MNWKFHIPDLKVGTLDQLVGLSDDLGNIHFYCVNKCDKDCPKIFSYIFGLQAS